MSSVLDALRALRRAVFKLIRVLFILAMVMLPLPIVMALSVVLDPVRRNLTAEVLKKKKR